MDANPEAINVSRKQFIKGGGLAVLLLLLARCGKPVPNPNIPDYPQPSESRISEETIRIITSGKNKVTAEDRDMFANTTIGLDLPLSTNQRVQEILRIPDIRERILTAVGFLDVETNPQYNSGIYACNLYALTLARMLLGDDYIGSRYLKADGTPWVLGRNDNQVNWFDPQSIDQFNLTHPLLDGNNLDWWLSTYGTAYGWKPADENAVHREMRSGTEIALVVNSSEYVKQQLEIIQEKLRRGEQADPFYGHVAVFVPGGKPGEFGVTQATTNYTYRPLDVPKDRLFDTQYRYYLHEVPQKSWIDARTSY